MLNSCSSKLTYKIENKMTIEELEKKLKITKDTCIHSSTFELTKKVLDIFNKLNLEWVIDYRKYINTWNIHKENTVYYPFNGCFSSLKFAQSTGYKVISAEEFIPLHTEGEAFDLENYIPKWELEGFPKEIIARMLECQEEQWNKRDVFVFERDRKAGKITKGIIWGDTKEGYDFWNKVIRYKNFDIFFERYPKKEEYQELKNNKKEEDSQEFRVGDEVMDIIWGQIGKIYLISAKYKSIFSVYVDFNGRKEIYELDGRYYMDDKYPRLLHYRDDYDYSIINFNNLPKRQEPKRWRAKKEGVYYFVNFFTKDWFFSDETKDDYDPIDNENYKSGNYFRTEIEGEIIAQKLNTYLKQLIKEEHEHEIKKQLK